MTYGFYPKNLEFSCKICGKVYLEYFQSITRGELMKIPKKVKELFDKEDLVSFSTADASGFPNAVPIYWKKIIDNERIILLDNFMKASKKNVMENEKVCVSFWNPKTEEAYKIKGLATYHKDGRIFDEGVKFIQEKCPGRIPKGVVNIEVIEIYSISPGPDAGKVI